VIIAVMQYVISFYNGQTIDLLSAVLMLSEEKRDDPRVEMAVYEMLKKQLWSKN